MVGAIVFNASPHFSLLLNSLIPSFELCQPAITTSRYGGWWLSSIDCTNRLKAGEEERRNLMVRNRECLRQGRDVGIYVTSSNNHINI
jgi:hypothetical protein